MKPCNFPRRSGHICCGFAAHRKHRLEADGRLVPMGWFTYAHIDEWKAEHYLDWGEQLPRQLQTLPTILRTPRPSAPHHSFAAVM